MLGDFQVMFDVSLDDVNMSSKAPPTVGAFQGCMVFSLSAIFWAI